MAIAVWALAYVSLLFVLLWSAKVALPYLAVSLIAFVAVLILLPQARASRLISAPFYLALGVLAISLFFGGYTSWRLAQLKHEWPNIVASRADRLHAELDRRISAVVQRGKRAAEAAASQATRADTARAFSTFELLRQ